ncbi:MAG TPA: carboxypeptidase-like regulatory domain-containing protein, partial [Luteimonas sp.]
WFPVGTLGPAESVTATFVAEVGPGSRGPELVNNAAARAANGVHSNDTGTVVRLRESLMTSRLTVVGRVVVADDCSGDGEGVPGLRVVMEDGTFASTDAQGAYHFAGVRPGTHVVQLDVATLPPGMELSPCLQNTRFAGRAYSQFVEGQGGSLLRADFRLRRGAPPAGEVGVRLEGDAADGSLRLVAELDAGTVAIQRLRAMLMLPDGASYVPGSATVDDAPVADPELNGNVAVFDLGDQGTHWRKRIAITVRPGACPAGGQAAKALALFEAGGESARTPPATLVLPCGAPPGAAHGERTSTSVTAAAGQPAASPFFEQGRARAAIVDDIAADGGGDVDWFKGQAAGRDWLFPREGRSPRSSSTRVVLKYLPGDKPVLKVNGEPVSLLKFDGTVQGAGGTIAVGTWRGVPLVEGDNLLQAEILDASGKVVATLERTVSYANTPARAELVPGQSILAADGIHNPVVAVRILDRHGNPVRQGVTGEYSLSPPYQPAASVQQMQERQLAGTDGAAPQWRVEGDEGIAYIELAPTGTAGSFRLGFDFGADPSHPVHQELEGWLKSAPRDWIVVGFARGSVGYDTLKDNMQALPEGESGDGVRTDGDVSLYAKGRVLGSWMLTLAYDSGKPSDHRDRKSLLSTIDPQQYYTLYGDGSHQGFDAASAEKLYLKLERDQFYALFGDFQTRLDRGELTRYQRTLTGVKVEYRGPLFEFNGFAARTSQGFARDELPGDGTSGLYRLSRAGILINSERVRLETRDRYHGERILQSRELVRHVDYDIDYDNGTLFFREPIASRDFDFNPNFIVVEYETRGGADSFLNAGGRAGVRLMDGRVEAGVTYVRDEDLAGRSSLAGIDAKFRLTERDELRAEAAASRGDAGDLDTSGTAWLLEWEHRGERGNLLAYARRQGLGFGLGQQNRSETGMFKAGVEGQWRVSERFSLRGEAYRLENLANGAVRNVASAEVRYSARDWNASAGLQWARDEGADGSVAESRQLTLGAARFFLDKRLELSARAEVGLGGANDSVDFPTRVKVGAAYALTPAFRLLAAHEITDGEDRDTATTRFGFEATPWKNARLSSTLNQSRISEYGPRTFALFGLNQKFLVGERWGLDVALDSSHAFNESGRPPLVVDPAQPIAAGGIRDGGALTEDFVALSAGVTYRTELWSWNARAEARQGNSERHGFTTGFLRQARDGVALSASMQAFSQRNADGSIGLLADAQLSWAYRPFASQWSMLDKLEFRLDEIRRGQGEAILGQDTMAAIGNARSRRLVNNFVLNYASDAWEAGDGAGNVLDLQQRSQLSLYYGSKYVLDSFGADDYAGYTDVLGAEWRFDLSPRIDIGLRASVLHSWSQDSFAWAFGPSVGFSPFANAWVSVGYNFRGFRDRDFEQAHHTAEGAYLVLRMKFDQDSLGLSNRAVSTGAGVP